MSLSRRTFLGTAAIGGIAAAAPAGNSGKLPTRVLGRTGANVSILAMGCGSRFLAYKEEDKALEALNRALDLGITYLDTAYSYGDGLSETRVGKVMQTRRKGVFVATKIEARNGDEAARVLEGSLKRLQMDQVDLVHIHGLMGEDDLAAIEAKDGVLNRFLKLRDEKVMRFIGVTCHADPAVLKIALERHDFDCTQMALNAGMRGMTPLARLDNKPLPSAESFEHVALPVAKRKNMGVTAMKIYAQEKLLGQAPPEKLLQYSLSLPVAAAVVGMPKLEMLEHNAMTARNFQPLSHSEMEDLSGRLSAANHVALSQYFRSHSDA